MNLIKGCILVPQKMYFSTQQGGGWSKKAEFFQFPEGTKIHLGGGGSKKPRKILVSHTCQILVP